MRIQQGTLFDSHHLEAISQHHMEWGSTLSLSEYYCREAFCALHNTIVPYYIIENNHVVGSLEVYIRHSVDKRCIWGICSVFVPEAHRQKGHATSLLQHIVTLSIKREAICVLFSDVGPFYNKFGFHTCAGSGYVVQSRSYACHDGPNLASCLLSYKALVVLPHSHSDSLVMDASTVYAFHYAREFFYDHVGLLKDDLDAYRHKWDADHHDMTVGCQYQQHGVNGTILWSSMHHKPCLEDNDLSDIQSYKHLAILDVHLSLIHI